MIRFKLSRAFFAPKGRLIERDGDLITIAMDGLFCSVCSTRVQRALSALPGASEAACSLETTHASVRIRNADDRSVAAVIGAAENAAKAQAIRRGFERLTRPIHRLLPKSA